VELDDMALELNIFKSFKERCGDEYLKVKIQNTTKFESILKYSFLHVLNFTLMGYLIYRSAIPAYNSTDVGAIASGNSLSAST
jgi:hypothetical protein